MSSRVWCYIVACLQNTVSDILCEAVIVWENTNAQKLYLAQSIS